MKVAELLSSGARIEVCEFCIEEEDRARIRRFRLVDGEEAVGERCGIPRCQSFRDVRPSEPHYRPHLFDLNEAVKGVSSAQGAADTAIATSKLVGKTLANVGVMAGKLGFSLAKNVIETAPQRLKETEVRLEDEMRKLEQEGRHDEADTLKRKLENIRSRRRSE